MRAPGSSRAPGSTVSCGCWRSTDPWRCGRFWLAAKPCCCRLGSCGARGFRRDQIRGVRRYSAADTGYLSLVVINEPQWLIELHEPVVVCGPFGRRKAVTRIGVAVDDGDAFCVALSHSLAF